MSDDNTRSSALGTASLNKMPAEIILQIFYQLCHLINNGQGHVWNCTERVTSMAQLNQIAITSKHLNRYFKESEYAIFRRLAGWSAPDEQGTPGTVDFLIKIGSLRTMPNRPTDPDDIRRLLQAVNRDDKDSRSLGTANFTPEVRIELDPRQYDDVLDWLVSRYRRYKPWCWHVEYGRDTDRTFARGQSRGLVVPPATLIEHPFEFLCPFFMCGTVEAPTSERATYYINKVLKDLEKYTKHVNEPWTDDETKYFDWDATSGGRDEQIRPCCFAKDCPRGPFYQ